jgi:hypothetical protein
MREAIVNVMGIDYRVREDGQIFSMYYKNKMRPIYQSVNPDGYLCIKLGGSKKPGYPKSQRSFRVHRIIAKAFIPNPNNYSEVDHLDGNRANNNASNLEWVTHRENIIRSHKRGNCLRKGEYNSRAKLTNVDVLKVRYLYDFGIMKQSEIAKMYDRGWSTIHNIVNRLTWTHI